MKLGEEFLSSEEQLAVSYLFSGQQVNDLFTFCMAEKDSKRVEFLCYVRASTRTSTASHCSTANKVDHLHATSSWERESHIVVIICPFVRYNIHRITGLDGIAFAR